MAAARAATSAQKRRHTAEAVRIDRVLFLGTGASTPVAGKRNMSSLAVLLSSGGAILIDCGEGTQHQIQLSTLLRAGRVEAVLLTHLHGDHCFGLFGLLQAAAIEGRREPMLLVGPEGLRGMVETVFRSSGGWFPEDSFKLEFLEIPNCGVQGCEDLVGDDGSGPHKLGFNAERCARAPPVRLGTRAGLGLQAVPLPHSVPDWGYVLTERDRPGTLDVAKAIELGVPAKSPLLGRLKGGEPVQLEGGTMVLPSQVVGPTIPGRAFAVLQDTYDSRAAVEPCRGAACVVHEATFEDAMEADALAKGHSTSTMAAKFAAACGAKRLVLTHFSARYSTTGAGGADKAEALGAEARGVLGAGAPVVVATDFMVLRADKGFEPEGELAMKRPPRHQAVDCRDAARVAA